MAIDPFLMSTGFASAVAAAGWIYGLNRNRLVRGMQEYQAWQDITIHEFRAENELFRERERAAQEQRVAASKRAAELKRQKSLDDREARQAATAHAMSATQIPPRSEVVAGVRETRPRRNSGAGQVAASQGG